MRNLGIERFRFAWKQHKKPSKFETTELRIARIHAQVRISEANRLVRRPAEDSPRGYARIVAARAKRARRAKIARVNLLKQIEGKLLARQIRARSW